MFFVFIACDQICLKVHLDDRQLLLHHKIVIKETMSQIALLPTHPRTHTVAVPVILGGLYITKKTILQIESAKIMRFFEIFNSHKILNFFVKISPDFYFYTWFHFQVGTKN
jgi:hypothetical protein